MNPTYASVLSLAFAVTGCASVRPAGPPATAPLLELSVAAPACTDVEVPTPPTALIERRPRSGAAAAGALYAFSEVLAARYAACGMHLERVRFEGEVAWVRVRDRRLVQGGDAGPAFTERWVRAGIVWRLDADQPRETRNI